MQQRVLAVAITTVASFGALAGAASANPTATVCGSVNVTVNGQALVDQATCQVLPPEGS